MFTRRISVLLFLTYIAAGNSSAYLIVNSREKADVAVQLREFSDHV